MLLIRFDLEAPKGILGYAACMSKVRGEVQVDILYLEQRQY